MPDNERPTGKPRGGLIETIEIVACQQGDIVALRCVPEDVSPCAEVVICHGLFDHSIGPRRIVG